MLSGAPISSPNSFPNMAERKSWKSEILLLVISVTLLIFTGLEVRAVIEFKSEADTAASSAEMEIV